MQLPQLTPELLPQWKSVSLFVEGTFLAVYEDGTASFGKMEDKPVLGIYGLHRLDDFEALSEEWQRLDSEQIKHIRHITEEGLRNRGKNPLAYTPAEQSMMDNAAQNYADILFPLQHHIRFHFNSREMPKLVLQSGNESALPRHHSIIAIKAGSSPETLATLGAQLAKRIEQEQSAAAGNRISKLDEAFGDYDEENSGRRAMQWHSPRRIFTPDEAMQNIINGPTEGYKMRNSKSHLNAFRGIMSEERDFWMNIALEYVFDPAINFGTSIRLLRVADGISTTELAHRLGTAPGQITQLEQGRRSHKIILKLIERNPFSLSPEGEAVIKAKSGLHPPSPHLCKATMNGVEAMLEERRHGRRSLQSLPTANEVLDALLFGNIPHRKTNRFGEYANIANITGHELGDIFSGHHNLDRERLEKLGSAVGLDEKDVGLLMQLPLARSYHLRKELHHANTLLFLRDVRELSSTSESFKELLHALRKSSGVVLQDVGRALGVTKETARRHEKVFIKNRVGLLGALEWIDKLVKVNPLRFEMDEGGKVLPEIVELLKAKAQEEFDPHCDWRASLENKFKPRWRRRDDPPLRS